MKPVFPKPSPIASPFAKRFKTRDHHYVYDVKRHALFRITGAHYEALPYMHCSPEDDEVPRKDAPFRKAVDELKRLHRGIGILGTERYLFGAGPPVGPELERAIETELNHLTLEVTSACNLRCTYCTYSDQYYGSRPHGLEMMSFSTARKAVDRLLEHSNPSGKDRGLEPGIGFYGGEPLLNLPLIRKVVQYARDRRPREKIHFHMTTNGTLLTPRICRYLADAGFSLAFSLDGPREVHDRRRRTVNGSPTHARVILGIRYWRDALGPHFKKKTTINCILDPNEDPDYIASYFEGGGEDSDLLAGLRLTSVGMPNDRCIKKPIYPSPAFLDGYFRIWERFVGKLGDAPEEHASMPFADPCFKDGLRNILDTPAPRHRHVCSLGGMCKPGGHKLFASVDGLYYPCERVPLFFQIGSVERGVDTAACDALNKKYTEFRLSLGCRECWAVHLCRLCAATIPVNEAGEFDRVRQLRECETIRYECTRNLNNYAGLLEKNHRSLRSIECSVMSSWWHRKTHPAATP